MAMMAITTSSSISVKAERRKALMAFLRVVGLPMLETTLLME
jgi:hypothetical protein